MITGATGSAAVAAANAIANALKASGAIISLEPTDFQNILIRNRDGLVAQCMGGIFKKHYKYITNYKGLFFFCKSSEPLHIPGNIEIVNTKRIWIPV